MPSAFNAKKISLRSELSVSELMKVISHPGGGGGGDMHHMTSPTGAASYFYWAGLAKKMIFFSVLPIFLSTVIALAFAMSAVAVETQVG